MGTGAITGYVDVAQLVLYLFWIFFAGLIIYLVREGKREGYPLETAHGTIEGWPPAPRPKTYLLHDGSTRQAPSLHAPLTNFSAEPANRFNGAPLEPVGDALTAGVGPGAWTERPDHPELTLHGEPKIVPMRTLPDYSVATQDRDPRGLPVIGTDGETGGTVVDLWVDRSEAIFRHLEVAIPMDGGGTRSVLLPINFCRITRRGVRVGALTGSQFAAVPATRDPQQVTMLEEEKIMATWGAGLLYATPERAEPLF